MSWLSLAFSAAFVWAIGNVLTKKGFEHVSPLWSNIIFNGMGLLLWVPLGLYLSHFSIHPLTWGSFAAIFLAYAAYFLYFYTLSKGELSLTGTLLSTYPVATVILSYIFLGERISSVQVGGILLVIVGSVLISLPEKGLPKVVRDYSWLRWGIISSILIGMGDFLSKYSVNEIGSYSQIFYAPIISIGLSAATYIFDKKNRQAPQIAGKLLIPSLIGLLLLSLGNIFFFVALGKGDASLVAPVSSAYPALMVLLAIIFLKEKVTKKQTVGIATTIVGIVLLGITV